MNLFKLTKIVLALVIALFITNTAQAAILNFDDATTLKQDILTNYEGFQWSEIGVLDSIRYTPSPSGYNNANTSGNYVVYNRFARTASVSHSLFDFVGANFTAAWYDNLQLTVEGLFDGVVTNSKTITLQPVGQEVAARFDFNFNGIDELRFNSFGGTVNTSLASRGQHFVMDDFEYNAAPAPEPSTAILGLMGIGSLLRRIRRTK